MLTWLEAILPAAAGFEFIQYLTAAVLVICFSNIAISVFFGIFAAFFRR